MGSEIVLMPSVTVYRLWSPRRTISCAYAPLRNVRRGFERRISLLATGSSALPIAVECCFADSSVWHFAQAWGPTYLASFLPGRHGVVSASPPLMPGPWARDLGRLLQSKNPITPTRTTMAEIFTLTRKFESAIESGMIQPGNKFTITGRKFVTASV